MALHFSTTSGYTSVGRSRVRPQQGPQHLKSTPEDDAPPYDPSLWEGMDTCFLTKLENETLRKKHPLSKRAQNIIAEEEVSPTTHTLPEIQPPSLIEEFVRWMFPERKPDTKPPNPYQDVSTGDLQAKLQAAMAAGDETTTVGIAQVLASRKATIDTSTSLKQKKSGGRRLEGFGHGASSSGGGRSYWGS